MNYLYLLYCVWKLVWTMGEWLFCGGSLNCFFPSVVIWKLHIFFFFGIWFVLYWVLRLRRSKECWCLWFEQIEEHYSAQGLGIVGYFHANERFDDLELDSIAKNIGNHICRYFPQCAVLLVCNCYLGILKVHCLCLLLKFFYHF